MGWFGGSSSGDTSGATLKPSSDSLDLSGGSSDSGFASKKRSLSGDIDVGSFDSSSQLAGSSSSMDVQRRIQMEQQKLQIMTAVGERLKTGDPRKIPRNKTVNDPLGQPIHNQQ